MFIISIDIDTLILFEKNVVERIEMRMQRMRKVVNQDIYRTTKIFLPSQPISMYVNISQNNASFNVSKAGVASKNESSDQSITQ